MSSTKLLTLENIITASGRYPERTKSSELTEEVKSNINNLATRVNALLSELGIKHVSVSSGFRPSAVNASIANAAKKSLHTQGKAVDLLDDKDQSLAKLIASSPNLLKKHDLWLEDPAATKGQNTNWVHLDNGVRKDRPSRTFKP